MVRVDGMEETIAAVTAQESVEAAPIAEAATTEALPSAGQAETPAAVESQPKPEPVDYRALYEKDPALKSFIEGRAGDIAKRLTEKELRKERLRTAKEDPIASLDFTTKEYEALVAEDAPQNGLQAKWAEVASSLAGTGSRKPVWAKDYNAMLEANQKEADELFAKAPDKYLAWAEDKVDEWRVERKVEKALKDRLPILVEAKATELTNQRTKNYPVLPTGSAGPGMSDDAFTAAYARGEVHDHKRAREILSRLK